MITPLLLGILFPALAAGIIWGLGWKLWRPISKGAEIENGYWSGAVGCALAVAIGSFGLMGWVGFPPRLAEGWLPFIAGGAALIALFESLVLRKNWLARASIWLVLLAVMVWLLMSPRRSSLSTLEYSAWVGGIAVCAWVGQSVVEALAERWTGASIPLSLWVWSVGIAACEALTGSLRYGQLAGVLAAAMGAGFVAALLKSKIAFSRGAVTIVTSAAYALLLCGYFYSDLPFASAVILALAPLILWIGETGVLTRQKQWIVVPARALLISVPVMVAVLIAAWPMIFTKPAQQGVPSSGPETY